MRRFSHCQGIRESDEVYIVSAGNHPDNIKIRDAKMDMKVLVEEWYGLEQWRPRMLFRLPPRPRWRSSWQPSGSPCPPS
jgi:hypothetical protein